MNFIYHILILMKQVDTGYNDIGRDKIDKIFARILNAEKAIARPQILSGTHALSIGHFAILRPR